MASIDNPRILPNVTVALQWQTTKGTAAASTSPLRLVCSKCDISRGSQRLHPEGTTGFQYPMDSEFEAAIMPSASLTMHLGATQMAPFLESISAGQPTVVDADVTEAGDTNDDLSTWAFTGLRPGLNTGVNATTKKWELFVTLTDSGGNATVDVYSDSARTLKVATGTGADSTTFTLSASNNSGLTGSVAVAVVGATNSGITLTIDKMTLAWANQWARWFTLWRDTTQEAERLIDCVVSKITITGSDLAEVQCEVEVMAQNYALLATIFSAGVAPPSLNFLAFNNGVFRSDLDGTPVTEYPKAASFTIARDTTVLHGGASNPQNIISERVAELGGSFTFREADGSDALFDRGIADSWDSVDLVYTRGTQEASFTFDKAKFFDAKKAATSEGSLDDVVMSWKGVQDSAAASTAPLAMFLKS